MKRKANFVLGAAGAALAALLAGPTQAFAAAVQAEGPALAAETAEYANPDPWEGFNRRMFALTETVDKAALEPVARGYRAVTPSFVRAGVRNTVRNLGAPVSAVNAALQGEFGQAARTIGRFGLNSTLGVAGVLDPASEIGLPHQRADFGQTLGRWGVAPGPYLYVPLRGPSTVRDVFGGAVDSALQPTNYLIENQGEFNAARISLTVLQGRESALEAVEALRQSSADPYVSIRTLYLQVRRSATHGRSDGGEDALPAPDLAPLDPPPEEVDAPDAATTPPAEPPAH